MTAPAARDLEAARELVRSLDEHMDEQGAIFDSGIALIAAALAAERERCCAAACRWCRHATPYGQGIRPAKLAGEKWVHELDGPGYYDGETEDCSAAAIRAAAARRESE